MKTPDSKEHALALSIQKYENLRVAVQNGARIRAVDIGPSTCACCAYSDANPTYDEDGDEIECSNCLVNEYTKEIYCEGTPWPAMRFYALRVFPRHHGTMLGYIQDEIDFLETVQAKHSPKT